MEDQPKDPALEIKRLQRVINDLVGLVALPAIWLGSEPTQIVETLLDVLLRMFSLDFALARLNDVFGSIPVEILRIAADCEISLSHKKLHELLGESFAADAKGSHQHVRNRLSEEGISIFTVPLGIRGEIGVIVVGANREGFPESVESLLLTVAANQASIGLQEVRLLAEQKRISRELDRRVAERTSELAQAHAQVLRSEERWRSVFENSAVGVALADLNGQFVATNPVFQEMVGYSEDELLRLTFFDITQERYIDSNRAMVRNLIEGKFQQFRIEKQYRRKDGQLLWTHNNVSIVPGADETPPLLIALCEDITQHKQSEEALAKARSELAKVANITNLGVLTASIAHEVNQPLSGIVTNASTCLRMLSADPPNVDGARETVRRTIRDGNRASDVITRLRSLYSRKEPPFEPMDLSEATREVTELSSVELQRSGVVLRLELADDLPPLTGDRVQLQQVILNLLRNAADAMSTIDDRPRELLVKAERHDGDHVRLSVKDSGVGVPAKAADTIFEAFKTTKADGMGMGLSVSRSIIEAHQGRLWMTQNDGPGSTFSFSIPCALASSTDAETRAERAKPATSAS